MRRLSRAAARQDLTRQVAVSIVAAIPPRDVWGRAKALRVWLEEHFVFQRDPVGVELLRDPYLTLRAVVARYTGVGDCDDAAMLGAALALAVSPPLGARFRVVGFEGAAGPFVHVVTDVATPHGWQDFDITRGRDPDDAFPLQPSRSYTVMV